jgi:hypothetical protein
MKDQDATTVTERPDAVWDRQVAFSLPWGSLLRTKPRVQSLGQRQLSLPMAIGFLAAMGAFGTLSGALAMTVNPGDEPPAQAASIRAYCCLGFIFSAIVLVGCIYWEKRRTARKDIVLDVLGEVLPASAIFEVGAMHLAAFATQVGGQIRIVVTVQNRFDQPAKLELSVADTSGAIPLEIVLDGSHAAVFFLSTLCAVDNIGVARLRFSIKTRREGGRQVRFAARRTLRNADREAIFTLLALAGGHVHVRLGSNNNRGYPLAFMNNECILAVRAPANAQGAMAAEWQMLSLWSPEHPMPPGFAASIFHKLLEDRPQPEKA